MSFRRAARAALAARSRACWMLVVVTIVLAGFSASCGNSSHSPSSSASHNAYVTLPDKGEVALLHVNDSTGVISLGPATPQVLGTSPTGIAIDPGKKFLYVGNVDSSAHSVSIYNITSDGTLTQTLPDVIFPAGITPRALAIDASGKYLLITTNFAGQNLLVFSLNGGSGAPTQIGAYTANSSPNNLTISPSSNFVYVANEDVSLITAFSLDSATGNLSPIPGSPFPAGEGVAGMAADPGSHFLYAANHTSNTVSAYTIDPNTGALKEIPDSPYPVGTASGPRAIATDTTGTFLYVANQGSSNVLAFMITAGTGQLTAINSGTPYATGTSPVFILAEPAGKYLYVGNQTSTNITGFSYDPVTGKLTAITGSPFTVGSAPGGLEITH
ncbi:MAG TPA: beta-propeller fold lactonase family protein [Terriglobales bacterium]|jgi:6-phosphogluconolactonase|nr:beta-propeller fold lactonase family protein [Terriglobales bacterium]